jgi:predicted GNAT superfamily acetyltransferase
MTSATGLRDLTTVAECRAVVELQEEVWGRDAETVPASLLSVSAKRGGILIGAFDAGRLTGFVWSMPGWREDRPTHWSHMLAVRSEARGRGLGGRLKRAQRDRALAQGVDLVEWTFDPLQAANAHLNLARLGGVAATYVEDAYGTMAGPLHRGTPTDRLIVEWWIRSPHVERRLAAAGAGEGGGPALTARDAEVRGAPAALTTATAGPWVACGPVRTDLDARRLCVPVPPDFTGMQQRAPDMALAWRTTVREVFQSYFARGYRAVDFSRDQEGGGSYLLARDD